MTSLQNHFLIAMPSLEDPYFSRSLTYICEHNEQGSMGIIVNQPAGMNLTELLKLTELESVEHNSRAEQIVLAGGPVSQDRGFLLHSSRPGYSASLKVSSEVMVTTSKDILQDLANDKAPEKTLVALGYAGWEAGQLEQELQHNSWLTIEADNELLFDVPIHKKWQTAVNKLGIDIWQLGPDAGHA